MKKEKMNQRSFALPLFFLLLNLAFFSCEKPSHLKTRPLKIHMPEDPLTLDPRKSGESLSFFMHFLLFEPLTKMRKETTSDFGIAEKIDISEDLLTYTFHLRPSQWSDGSSIRAQDFEYSWKSMLNPHFICPNVNMLYFIKNAEQVRAGRMSAEELPIKAIDDHTLEVTLAHPTPFFLNVVSFCALSPVKASIVKDHPNWADSPSKNYVTNGPYRIKRWKKDNEIVLEKNPFYWDEKNILLKEIHISIIHDENTAVSMFEKGDLDILGVGYSDIPLDALDYFKKTKTLFYLPLNKTIYCSFNTQKFPFHNKWIRQALSLSINRREIIENIEDLQAMEAHNFIPPTMKNGVNKQFFEPFNISLASICLQKGLEELKITREDLKRYTLIYTPSDTFNRLAQIIQSDWKKYLGIDIPLQGFDKKLFYTKAALGDYDICLHFFTAQYNDQMSILDRFRLKNNSKNFCKWESEAYNNFLYGSYFQTDKEREATLEEAEKIFIEDMPIAPIYHSGKICAIKPYVKGFYFSPMGFAHVDQIQFENIDQKF